MTTGDKIVELYYKYMVNNVRTWSEMIRKCESPIEKLFFTAAMLNDSAQFPSYIQALKGRKLAKWANIESSDGTAPLPDIVLRTSHQNEDMLFIQPCLTLPSGKIRLDAAYLFEPKGKLEKVCIELDGHDFHERTKEQSANDKSRDRQLQSLGWSVLRFTGSEVFNDPEMCIFEIIEFVGRRLELIF